MTMKSAVGRALAERSAPLEPGLRNAMVTASHGMVDVIGLARGDPDFNTPLHVIEAAQRALEEGWTHYTPWSGLPELRREIARKLDRENGLIADPDSEIVVTTGAQASLFVTMQLLIGPGDEVLMPDPHYSAYDAAIELAGGIVVPVPTRGEDQFELHVETLECYVTPRTKAIVLVDPGNPSGSVLSPRIVERIAEFARRHDLVVVSDEVYEKLVYDGCVHTSIASLPGMRDRTVSIFSFSKSYAMTGWRIGYMVAPSDFLVRATELHYVINTCAPAPSQVAAIAALKGPQTHIAEMNASYVARRDYLISAFERLGLPSILPHGGFTIMVDIRAIGMGSVDFSLYLLQKAKVQVFPGAMYGANGEGYVRVSVLASLPRLEEAIRRISLVLPPRI
jgi:aminotransferase